MVNKENSNDERSRKNTRNDAKIALASLKNLSMMHIKEKNELFVEFLHILNSGLCPLFFRV